MSTTHSWSIIHKPILYHIIVGNFSVGFNLAIIAKFKISQ